MDKSIASTGNGERPRTVGDVIADDSLFAVDGINPFEETENLFPPIRRNDKTSGNIVSNGRFYTPQEEWWKENYKDRPIPFFPSSTTILKVVAKGMGWDMWLGNSPTYEHAMDYGRGRANIGTVVHEMIQHMIFGNEVVMEVNWWDPIKQEPVLITREMMKYLMSFQKFWNDYGVTLEDILACEIGMLDLTPRKKGVEPITSKDYKYPWGGSADLVTYLNNSKTGKKQLWLIDFKTGKEYADQHQLQLISYAILFNATSTKKIKRIGSLYLKSGWRKAPTYKLKEYDFKPILWRKAFDFWKFWAKVNKHDTPKFPMELPEAISLYGGNDGGE